MITSERIGDLLEFAINGNFDVIIHGCNCFCSMGAGIARSIAERFPEAYIADQRTIIGDRSKLGTYTSVTINNLKIINAYTQYDCGGPKPIDYNAVETVFTKLNYDLAPALKIGIPLIGAGLAGGDWNTIQSIINRVTPNLNITVVHFQKS